MAARDTVSARGSGSEKKEAGRLEGRPASVLPACYRACYFPSHLLTTLMCDFTYFSAAFCGSMCCSAIQLETMF
jgi:hypothetical protein